MHDRRRAPGLTEPRREETPAPQLDEAVDPRRGLTPAALLRMQEGAGNAAVAELVQRGQRPQGAAPEQTVQRSILDDIGDFVGDVGEGIADTASDVGDFVVDTASDVGEFVSDTASDVGDAVGGAASRAWGAVTGAASAAWEGISGLASDLWDGAKAMGGQVVSWLRTAGSHVLNAINWFGDKAWKVISAVGTFAWEKLSLMGSLAWSWVSNLPERLWRLAIDGWDAITGAAGWLWTGLVGAAGHAWDAVTGVFDWVAEGAGGAMRWIGRGIESGASWALDFIENPSFEKLRDGLLGTLDWLGDGVKGLGRWGWNGVVAAAKWAKEGLVGFGNWLWDGAIGGIKWFGEVALHLLELMGAGEALQLLWGLIFRLRPLTSTEINASGEIHPGGIIPYWQVRVDEDSVLIKIGTYLGEKLKSDVLPGAITTMHIIHTPAGGISTAVMVHELTHVLQYELMGAMYMAEAIHAQQFGGGYKYGDISVSPADGGRHYADMNREQQAQMCEDYYLLSHGGTPHENAGVTKAQLEPYMEEMRALRF